MTYESRTPGEAQPIEPELLSDEELLHLHEVDLVDAPLEEFADLLTASQLRSMRQEPA